MSESLCGRSLVSKLFAEVTGKANSVLFVHPQLALCGLVHSVDEQHHVFGYSHVPSLSNIFLLASHAYGRTGRPQAVVMMGEWSPTLVQALVACVHDTIGERTSVLRWADPAADPARLQAVLYLLLLFSTLSGRLSAMALSVNLRHSSHTSATSLSVSPLWLFPRLLTTLRDAGETSYLLHIPIFQHVLSAPAALLEACIPRQTLAHLASIHGCTAGAAEAVRAEKWSELVDLVTGAVAPAGAGFADEALESCVRGFSLILLLLDTRFQEGSERMMPNLQAMLALLGMDEEDPAAVKTLLQALGPHIDQQTGLVSSALPDALYLDALGWAASLLDSTPPTPLALEAAFPFATERYRGSGGGDASQFYTPGAHADRFSVSLVYFPQSGPDLRYRDGPAPAKTAAAAAAAAASTDLPSCLAPHVMLANVAAEHANVWAAKTLLADAASSAKMRDAVAVVDELMQPSAAAAAPPPSRRGVAAAAASAAPPTRFAQVLSVGSYLETGAGQGGGGAAVRVDRAAKVLTLRHTHGAVSYPFGDVVERVLRTRGVEGVVGEGTALVPGCGGASGLLESYLVALAAFLAPQLACDPLFALHVPLYLSTDGGRGRGGGGGGAPVLYERLRRKTEAAIDSSVFLTAAKELYRVAAAKGGAPGADEAEAAGDGGVSTPSPPPPPSRQQRQQQQPQPAAATSSADYHVLQTQLQRMDDLDSREPPATVSVHSTPDRKAAPATLPSPSYSRPTSTSARRRTRSPATTSAATAASAARRRNSAAAAAAAAVPARDEGGSSKGRTEIACQIAQLQRELERMDILDNEEPAPTVSHHSTPEKAAERRREGAARGLPSASRHSRAASGSRRSGSRSASGGGGGGGAAASARREAVNPLQGSLEHMVHMTKAYRLRQQSLQKKSAKQPASSSASPQASVASPSPSPSPAAASSSMRRSPSASSSAGPAAVHLRAATALSDFNTAAAAAAPLSKHREALAPLAHRNSLRSSLPMSSPVASTAAAASTTPGRSMASSSPRRPAVSRSSSRSRTGGSGSGGFRATPKDAPQAVPRREEHGGGGGGAFTEANWHDMLAAF